MKREELIRALRRLAPETGSLCCLGCGYAHSCSTHGCTVIRAAIDEIEALRKPPNDPLTLEELREMAGEPVWNDTMKQWAIVDTHDRRTINVCGRWRPISDRYYRRKPEEGTTWQQ